MYQLQDVKEPNLYRDIYNYEEIPKVTFNRRRVPMCVPDEIWITDTTFPSVFQEKTKCRVFPRGLKR